MSHAYDCEVNRKPKARKANALNEDRPRPRRPSERSDRPSQRPSDLLPSDRPTVRPSDRPSVRGFGGSCGRLSAGSFVLLPASRVWDSELLLLLRPSDRDDPPNLNRDWKKLSAHQVQSANAPTAD